MNELMVNMNRHVVKVEGSESLTLDNSTDMHRTLSSLLLEIRRITEYHKETIKGFGNCISLICLEFINLQKWYSKIPELIILHSRISCVADHRFLLLFLRSLSVFFKDKKDLTPTDREIIFSLILKNLFNSTKHKCFDFSLKNKPIVYHIHSNRLEVCRMEHPSILHIFIWNLFREVKGNLRRRFKNNKEANFLTHEQHIHIQILMNIHLYGHLRILELYNYKSYKSEEYTFLLNDLKEEVGCYGCLFGKYLNLFTLRRYNE